MRRLLIETTNKVDAVFDSMKGGSSLPVQGIFFDGQDIQQGARQVSDNR